MNIPAAKKPSYKPRIKCVGFGVIMRCDICGNSICTKCEIPHTGVGGIIAEPVDAFVINGVNSRNYDWCMTMEICNECLTKYFREIPLKWGSESMDDYRERVKAAEMR